MSQEILRPSGAGANTGISSQFPDSGSHYDKVDEQTLDYDATYVHTNAVGYEVDTYALDNPTTIHGEDDITNVRVSAYVKEQYATGNGKIRLYLGIGASIIAGGAIQDIDDEEYTLITGDWATSIDTGIAWTLTELNDLQAGMAIRNEDGSYTRVSQVFVTVSFNDVTTTTTTSTTSTTSTSTTSTSSTSTTSTSSTSTTTSTTSTSSTSTTTSTTSTSSSTTSTSTTSTSTTTTSTTSTSTTTTSISTTSTSTTSTSTSSTSTSTTSTSTSTTSTSTTSTSTTTSTTSTSTTTSTTSTSSTSTTSSSTSTTTTSTTTTSTTSTSTSTTTTSTSTTSTSTTSTSTTTTTGIQKLGNPIVVRTTGDIGEVKKSLTIIGMSFWGLTDNAVGVLYDEDAEQLVWNATCGTVATVGNNVNGPPLCAPLTVRHLTCRTLTAGSILYVYLR